MSDTPNGTPPSAPAAPATVNGVVPFAPAGPLAEKAAKAAAERAKANPAQAAADQVLGSLPKTDDKKTAAKAPAEAAIEEVEDTLEDVTPEEKKKLEAEARKAWKLKVGGKDLEVDEAELLKRAQMGYSADQKWQEAAQMRKQMDGFIQLLQRDPAKALEQMGFNVDELAENRIKARIEEMQKTPEQIEREKMQKELEELKQEREREKQAAQAQEQQRLQDQFAVEIENDISQALDNNSFGFPKTPYVVKRIADTMILAVQEGIRTNNEKLIKVSAKDVLPIVQREIKAELAEMYAASPDDVFEQLVGKDRLNKYRRAKVKKTASPTAKETPSAQVKPTGTSELNRQQAEKPKDKLKAKDFFKNLGSK